MQLRSGKTIELRREVKPFEYMSISSIPLYDWFLSRISAHLKNICEYDDISKYDDINYKYNTKRNKEITALCTLIKVHMKELLFTTDFRRDVLQTLFCMKRTMYELIETLFELDPYIWENKRDYPILHQLKTVVDNCYAYLCYLIDNFEIFLIKDIIIN